MKAETLTDHLIRKETLLNISDQSKYKLSKQQFFNGTINKKGTFTVAILWSNRL